MHGLIVPDLLLCLFMLMLSFSSRYCRIYCSFILMPYLYWYYTSIFLFLLFFPFLCALAGPVLPDPNFSALSLRSSNHCTREPRLSGVSTEVLVFCCILVVCFVMTTRRHNTSVFCHVPLSLCTQTKPNAWWKDVFLICDNAISDSFVCEQKFGSQLTA